MDWFTQLTGFEERSYKDTKSALKVEGIQLRSLINGASYQIGELGCYLLSKDRTKRGLAKDRLRSFWEGA